VMHDAYVQLLASPVWEIQVVGRSYRIRNLPKSLGRWSFDARRKYDKSAFSFGTQDGCVNTWGHATQQAPSATTRSSQIDLAGSSQREKKKKRKKKKEKHTVCRRQRVVWIGDSGSRARCQDHAAIRIRTHVDYTRWFAPKAAGLDLRDLP
jgi:hypothetical protein